MTDVATLHDLEVWTPEDTFGARLALIRQRFHWNVSEAATACGIAPATWTKWEEGAQPRDYMATCHKIASTVNCSEKWLVAGAQNWKVMRAVDLQVVPGAHAQRGGTPKGEDPNQLPLPMPRERPRLISMPTGSDVR